MGKYKIIPSSRTIVHSPISIGHKAEKGVEAIEFDLTAWVETYGSGTATIVMKRWGDSIPYPVALEIDENNKATWTLSDTDTAKAGMAYAQLNYIVGDEVVKKSDIYTFCVMDSLTGEGDPPEAYESWLEHLTHLAAQAMAEVLDIEGIVTDKTLTVDGGIADAKATGDALSALEDQFSEETDKLKANLSELQEGGYVADQQKIQEKIDSWLEDHPEAVAAIPDGSLTESKIADALKLKTVNGYVTPQMYGAKADGTTDDFTAFQNAFASGKKVLILNGSYYLSDYLFVDESQVIDNKGTYVNKKLIISKSVTSAPMSIADRKSITLAQLGTRWGSGVAYNSDTGKLICCGYEDDKIAQVDFETLTVDTTATIAGLAHGNDATYNPNTQKYYCVPMVNNGEIMSINNDLTLDAIITISGMNFAPSQISYDPENDIYYVGNSQYTYAVDANFNVIKLLSTHTGNEIFNNVYENINVPVSQGSVVYNGQFLSGAWLGASGLALLRGRSYARLVSYNYKTGAIKDFYDFPLHINTEEFESVEVIDGILCLFSCRFGTLFITKVYPEKIYLAHDTTKYPYYVDPTYTANSYCTETDVKRIRTFIHGNIVYIRCNLLLSTTMPANTRDVLIGNLGVHIYDETSIILASQSNLGNLLLNIKTDGRMLITNVSTTVKCQGFYRANIPVMLT